MDVIETTDLTKRYGSFTAVDGLELLVEDGEVFCYLGPNGAGKSTTISMLMGQTRPSAGRYRILGEDPRTDRSVYQHVGYVPDQFSLFPRLTGREHVDYAVEASRGVDDPDMLLSRVGLSDAANRRATDYSTGMSRRLALAMALAGEPDLLLLDEPFAGLDPGAVRVVRRIVLEANDRGTTIFLSSHVMGQVARLADRVGILVDGRLVSVGSTDDLRTRVATRMGVVPNEVSIEDVYVYHADGEHRGPPVSGELRRS